MYIHVMLGVLILSVVAPLAEAQTNTERLARVDVNTSQTFGMVDGMWDMVSELHEMASEMLYMMRESFGMISDVASRTHTIYNVMERAIHTMDVVEGNIHSIRNHTEQALHVAESMAGRLEVTAASSIEANARTGLIETRTADIMERLDKLEVSVDELADEARQASARATSLESLMMQLPTVAAALGEHDMPDELEASRRSSQIEERRIQEEKERENAVPGELRAGSATQTLSAYHMQRYGDAHDTVYTLHMEMTCDRDIFVDGAYASNRHNMTYDTGMSNILEVGDTIYHSQLEIAGEPYDVRVDMGLESLAATTPLRITMTQDDMHGIIGNSSRYDGVSLADITIEWYTVYETVCSFGFDGQSGFDGDLVRTGILTWRATAERGGLLNEYADTISCMGNPARIDLVQAGVSGQWPSQLGDYAKFAIRNTVDDHIISLSFDDNGSIYGEVDYTFYDDLVIYGTLPVVEDLVVQVQYVTTADDSCMVLP